MTGLVVVLASALIVFVLWDAFETIILPRRVTRRIRLTAFFYRTTWRPWSAVTRRLRKPRRREAFLGYYGPLSTLLLLSVWAAGLVLGFAVLHWALHTHVHDPGGQPDFWTYLYLSGTTYFTLGLGDVTPQPEALPRVLVVLESGLGFGFLALVIGYFPVLYQAFSRREVSISLMDARGGSPSTAVEFLRHHGDGSSLDALDGSLQELEHWTAELLESHISYPVLSYFRSQHDNQSWLGAITSALDACALIMTGIRGVPARQAKLTFAMARHAVADISQVLHTPPASPQPDRLPPREFARVQRELGAAGLHLEAPETAQQRLAEIRAFYEPYVNALSLRLAMRLPAWAPEKRVVHNWETTAWGRTSAASEPVPPDPVDDHV